ncbi:helix-turn-helix domain-containing protein [Sphingobium sp. AN641]|uniref:TetR/AcrR family transcriptional regulator n=1 Tax=Sphingobium sp. AN641 TaxID=3133443 RepID=UPI0030C13604
MNAMPHTPTVREPRRDAQRNRAYILDAARQAFLNEGVEVSMDAIAKKAGVGAGTLYRHFPNKDALLAALLDLHHATLDEQRTMIEAEERNSGQALERWIDALGDWMLAYHGLPEPLRAACKVESALTPTCLDVIATTETFLQAAQNDGFARSTLQGRDIYLGALAIAWASGITTADQRIRTVLRDMLKDGWSAHGANSGY